jgi:hypothetical protein
MNWAILSHPGLVCSPPPFSVGLLARPGWLPCWCSAHVCLVGWAFACCAFVEYALHFLDWRTFDHISMYFMNKSYETLSLQYMWKYVNSKSICVESLFISPILDIIGSQIWSLGTANKSPKLNLCSS